MSRASRLPAQLRALLGGAESLRERELLTRCARAGLPRPELQWRIVPTRQYRWDAAFPAYQVAVELQGGIWTGGRHGRGRGLESDAEKANLAALMGWTQITVTPGQVASGKAVEWIAAGLRRRGWTGPVELDLDLDKTA